MFRFTIRDVLLLTVIVALSISWWIDNKRIEKAVTKLERERWDLQADFEDRQFILKETQEKLYDERWGRFRKSVSRTRPEKSQSLQD
jgi:hypothetical protein